MGLSIIGCVLALLGLVALALQRFYSSVPARELKRLAARGDHLAVRLYRAVAYGPSLRLLLWSVVVGGLSGAFLLFGMSLPAWAAFPLTALVLLLGLVGLQSARLTVRSAGFAAMLAPSLSALLGWIEPVFGRMAHTVTKHRKRAPHSGLYEKEDLINLFEQQQSQTDNRIAVHELDLARRALHFEETQAADVMTARTGLKSLKASDAIGPILLGELHDSGQTSFIVYDDAGEQIVGVLHLIDAIKAKEGGKVSTIMSRDIVYAHEDFSLRQTLDVCLRTGQPLALVINGFEELVGAISLETLMQELLGSSEGSEELPYENRAEIAAYRTASPEVSEVIPQEAEAPPAQPDTSTPSSEAPEVVQ